MSTFRGFMPEFPDILVDYFRTVSGRRPPLACFLSHVHSDHLAGLESFRSPFVYCSAATKELLLRLERYPHRLNFALGILESHKQQYKHLKNLLKPIPLETPTRIELAPGNDIQATLFDANHCTGAVMFLIESDSKAVLYTGDIRSEPWFVNGLTRNPFLIQYTSGLKKLDCIYLDTSNTDPVEFPTKADGIKELLQKVSNYPPETVFHFAAWTFGYEEVWMALSRALKSQIHVDHYKLRLYQSLRRDFSDKSNPSAVFLTHDGPVLAGYICGNTPQAGCLTSSVNVRLHSCEKGMHCELINEKTVWIKPIITRMKNGLEIGEIGVGGGGGDLIRRPELELDNGRMIDQFLGLFAGADDLVVEDIKQMLLEALRSTQRSFALDEMGFDHGQDELQLSDFTKILAKSVTEKRSKGLSGSPYSNQQLKSQDLPTVITFPYSRHSSYDELCHLIRSFDPNDIYPCTSDEARWHEGVSMRHLFSHECSATTFRHDEEMRALHAEQILDNHGQGFGSPRSQSTTATQLSQKMPPPSSPLQKMRQTPPRKVKLTTIQENIQGEDYLLVTEGSELIREDGSQGRISTPPSETVVASPGSESQGVRRRVILEGIRDRLNKRPRMSYEEPGSSAIVEPPQRAGPILRGPNDSEPAVTGAGTQDDTQQSDEDVDSTDPYFDSLDRIYRCGSCGHELWCPMGMCTGCGEGAGHSYVEVLDPECGPQPEFAYNEYDTDGMSSGGYSEYLDDYLDNDSSAYDSLDETYDRKTDEYEINSFIDEEAQPSDNDESFSSDEEEDYKEKFEVLRNAHGTLSTAFTNLNYSHDVLMDDYEELRYAFLGTDNEDQDDSDDFGGEGVLIVDVTAPDPVVTEVVISHATGDSQASEISPERLRDRVEAFEAANAQDWHNVSLVSAGDNHTFVEMEL